MPHFLTSSLTTPNTLQSISINRNFSTRHGAPEVEPILRNLSVVASAESSEEQPLKWGKVQRIAIDDGKGENRLVCIVLICICEIEREPDRTMLR